MCRRIGCTAKAASKGAENRVVRVATAVQTLDASCFEHGQRPDQRCQQIQSLLLTDHIV
jgi:hypothetical protein